MADLLHSLVGGAVALVRSTPDRVVRVRGLAGEGNPKTRNPESQVILLPIQRVKTILNIHKS